MTQWVIDVLASIGGRQIGPDTEIIVHAIGGRQDGSVTPTPTPTPTPASFSDDFTSETPNVAVTGQNGWSDASGNGAPVPTVRQSGQTRFFDLGGAAGGSSMRPETWTNHVASIYTYHGSDCSIAFRFGYTDAATAHYLLLFDVTGQAIILYFGTYGAYTQVAAQSDGNVHGNTNLTCGMEVNGATITASLGGANAFNFTETNGARLAVLAAGGKIGVLGYGSGTSQRYVITYDVTGTVVP